MATRERQLSRLESLPAELRNIIYRYAVVEDEPDYATKREHGDIQHKFIQPALAMTCKQIREEVLPIFFAENGIKLWMCICSECNHPSPCTCSDSIKASGMARCLRAAGEHVPLIKHIGVTQFLAEGALPVRKICATIMGKRLEFNLINWYADICQCALRRLEKAAMPDEGVELVKLALETCIEQTKLMCACSKIHICAECNGFYFG